MKKVISIILAGVMALTFVSCDKAGKPSAESPSESSASKDADSGSTGITFDFEDESGGNTDIYTVDNEDKAQKMISCSHKNMFGLEKIVFFGERLVAVFDKDMNTKNGGFLGGNDAVRYIFFSFNNLSPAETDFNIRNDGNKYILEAVCRYEESDLIDPEREVKITRIYIKGESDSMNIDIYADDLEIDLYKANGDSHSQSYDSAGKEWSDVRSEIFEPEQHEETGISISYDLTLADSRDGYLTSGNDGVDYTVTGFGYYLTILVENNSDSPKTIGGTRYLQRVKDDVLIDLGRDRREDNVAGEKVRDKPSVKIWAVTEDPEDGSWKHSPEPDIILYGNETIETEPGKRYLLNVLVYDFDTDKDGTYRLTFGEVQMDFDLEWMMIW